MINIKFWNPEIVYLFLQSFSLLLPSLTIQLAFFHTSVLTTIQIPYLFYQIYKVMIILEAVLYISQISVEHLIPLFIRQKIFFDIVLIKRLCQMFVCVNSFSLIFSIQVSLGRIALEQYFIHHTLQQ